MKGGLKMFCNDPPSLYSNSILDFCFMNGIFSADEIRNSYVRLQGQSTINEINRNIDSMLQTSVPYYGLNEECVNVYGKPKKKLTIYDLDRLIFPFDPIRDWVEKEVKRINEKYSWAEAL